jgi:RNA polymerase primary sigma factor
LLLFEAEKELGDFFDQHKGNPASGTLLASGITSSAISGVADGSWDLDLSPAVIAGEGMGAGTAVVANHGADTDFLQVRNGGRQSLKRAVAQTGTRISITSELCITWAEEILAKGRCSLIDIDLIVAHCEGNSDIEELRINLQCNLEAAGFVIDSPTGHVDEFWNTMPDISSDDLAEAIQATLSRRTRLPGTGRFVMDKSDELQLLEPMVRARQELQLGILRSEAAVSAILDTIDDVMAGHRPPGNVSLRAIIPARLGHAMTSDFMAAADSLKSWQTNGRVMSGKQRREALNALENLDLSLAYHKELICKLRCVPSCLDDAAGLDALISTFEEVTERLVIAHLPYARRFAARNVQEFEDPEDVFQVAFMGLHRSTRRFDPERGFRFLIYATYWMRQAIARWRADEGSAIRIPVHRGEKIVKFDYALSKLDVRANSSVLDDELAGELEWTTDEVRQFRAFPRAAVYPDSVDDWEKLLPEQEATNVFDQDEVEMILKNAIADLPERQADIIRMRFGIGREAEMTLEEIGQLYGVTRERIRQIEAKGLDRLSHPGRKRRLHDLLGM